MRLPVLIIIFLTFFGYGMNAFFQEASWQNLINEKGLSGWQKKGNFETEVKDKVLFLNASHAFNNAWLLTEKSYSNFKLEHDGNAQESHIVLYVNGHKSAEAYLPERFNKAGNICLQAGMKIFTNKGPSNIYFKDVEIKNMDGI